MKCVKNEGSVDRVLRIVLGLIVILASYYNLIGVWQIVVYVIGAILILTGISGYCCLYNLFRINTNKKRKR